MSFVAGCGTLPVNITGNTNVCANQSTTLTATGGTSYRWSTGSTYASITVYPATSQTYTVTAYDTYGCSTSKTADINVLPLPDVQISGSTDICQGESTTLNGYRVFINNDVLETQYFMLYTKSGRSAPNLYAKRQNDGRYNNPMTGENYFGDTKVNYLKCDVDESKKILHVSLEMESLVTERKIKLDTAVYMPSYKAGG